MEEIFLTLLNMSIAASLLIFVVILARWILKNAPKCVSLLLWCVVAVRLVLPVLPNSEYSLMPYVNITEMHWFQGTQAIEATANKEAEVQNANNEQDVTSADGGETSKTQMVTTNTGDANRMDVIYQPWVHIAGSLWLTGCGLMLLYGLWGYVKVRKRLHEAVQGKDGIWYCDHIETAMVFGIIRPKVYLPSGLSQEDARYIIAHERSHVKRGDHLWKFLGFLFLSVYWFHPLVWVSWILFARDLEKACDERVIRNFEMSEKKAYANALVTSSMHQQYVFAYPLAFGEIGVKSRVKSILNHKKPTLWILLASILVIAGVAICFLTNPGMSLSCDAKRMETITLRSGSTGEMILVTDRDEIEKIIGYVNDMSFQRGKISLGYIGWGYLIQISGKGMLEKKFYLNSPDYVRKDPYFYQVEGGEELYRYLRGAFLRKKLSEEYGNEIAERFRDMILDLDASRQLSVEEQQARFATGRYLTGADEIAAISLILEVVNNWQGVTLHNLRYDLTGESEEMLARINERAQAKGWGVTFVKSALFLGDFHTPTDAMDWGSFNADEEYENWSWILGCTEDGEWRIVDQGY